MCIEIYCDGTDGIISVATDDLKISAADDVVIQVQGSETAVNCIGNGKVSLYYNNTERWETLSDGAGTDGDIIETISNGGGKRIGFNVGDSFTAGASWSDDVPAFTACISKASLYIQYKEVGTATWYNMSAFSPLYLASGSNPQTAYSCGRRLSCSSCPESATWVVKAGVSAAGKQWAIRVKVVCADTHYAPYDEPIITVNALSIGGNHLIPLKMRVTQKYCFLATLPL